MKQYVRIWLSPAVALAFCTNAVLAQAQDYPSKPVRIVLEFAAGAGGDVMLRVVTAQLSSIMGQAVVVENRAGAGGVVAAEAVIRSAPDGYTLLGATPNAMITRAFLAKSNTIEWNRDLTPVTGLWNTPSLVMTSTTLPVNSMKELIDYAKANPGKISYGTTGIGTHHHFNAEQIMQLAGVQFVHVPYKANAQAFQDLVGGAIPMVIGIAATAAPFLKSGKIRVLAVVEKRIPAFPDTPAVADSIPGFEGAPSWTALFGPAKLPSAIVRRLNADVLKALSTPEVRSREGFEFIGESQEAFVGRIQREFALVGRLVKAANIQPLE
jgi:tripartite-type tricarboxylate transporter receptor subunit TctC